MTNLRREIRLWAASVLLLWVSSIHPKEKEDANFWIWLSKRPFN